MNKINEFGQSIGEPLPEWCAKALPSRITLSGQYCRLEPLSLIHTDDLFNAYGQDTDLSSWTWLTRTPYKNKAEFSAWIESVEHGQDRVYYAIINLHTQRAVGLFSLMRIDNKNGVVEVGDVHFSSLLRGTVMSTEAHWLLMRYVFDTLKYRRYEWKCNHLNEPSRRAALRLGFQFEGCFRQALVVKGHNRDTDWFSIIDGEWPQLNRAFQRWLSPDNFDQQGQQRLSLSEIRAQM